MLEKRRYYVRRNSEYSLLFSTSCTVDRMKEDSAIKTVPTIGFNMEQIEVNNLKMQVWDLGGQSSIRPYW